MLWPRAVSAALVSPGCCQPTIHLGLIGVRPGRSEQVLAPSPGAVPANQGQPSARAGQRGPGTGGAASGLAASDEGERRKGNAGQAEGAGLLREAIHGPISRPLSAWDYSVHAIRRRREATAESLGSGAGSLRFSCPVGSRSRLDSTPDVNAPVSRLMRSARRSMR